MKHGCGAGHVAGFGDWMNRFLIACLISGSLVSCVSIDFSMKNVKSGDYTVQSPNAPWTLVDPGQADRAYRHPDGQAVLSVNSVCHQYQDYSLEDLTRNLLSGIAHPLILKRVAHVVDGHPALETIVEGQMDNTNFHLGVAVVRTRTCVYDFTLITRPESFAKHEGAFRQFYQSLKEKGAPPP